MVSCFLVTAVLMFAATRIDAVIPVFVALGALSGLAAGPIMSLPARVLQPETRALGMGVFFSISYVGLVLGPSLGGTYATWAGSAAATFELGAVVLLICPIVLWVFQRLKSGVNNPRAGAALTGPALDRAGGTLRHFAALRSLSPWGIAVIE